MARLLGRESVSSDVAALFELVKNSYDADAEKVKIMFEDFSQDQTDAKIIIEDDGNGMDLDSIESKWMVIGTDIKEREQLSARKHRRVIGNKGVGRFSTERLCTKLTLISKPRNSNDLVTLRIDWDKYEEEQVTFNDVENLISVIKRDNNRDSGTKLILESLREEWTDEKINRLNSSLGSLMLPPELMQWSDDRFSVELQASDFKEITSGPIQSNLFKYAPFKITAKIAAEEHSFKVIVKQQGKLIKTEVCDLTDTVMANGDVWRPFGPCSLTIYFFPGKSRYEDWDKYYAKALRVKNIRSLLDRTHGTKIYRDGFWVRPYGELGDDWLGLEEERVQANFKVGNSQIIGFVQISREKNLDVLDTTARERLVENNAFHAMRTFVKETIDVVSEYRRSQNKKQRENETKKIHRNIIESEVKHFLEMIESNRVLSSDDKKKFKGAVNGISKTFTQFEVETESDIQELEISQRAYRNLASLGISSATTAHEVKELIAHLGEIPIAVLNKLKNSETRKLIESDIEDALAKINTVRYYMKFIIEFVRSLAYDSEIKHEKEQLNINDILNTFFKQFTGIIETHNLQIKWKVSPEKTKIFMNKADFESIILNLLSNAIKALQRNDTTRKILITISKDSKLFKIKFSDNGQGVLSNNREKIFRLFFTTNKQGTGLGLPIIKEIVEDYGGIIRLEDESELENGATFLITIPLKEVSK